MLMNLELLRIFVTIAELRSLTKAALALDTVQPNISRNLSSLEREVGGRLFHRTGRGVELSPLGEALLPQAVLLLRQSDAFIHKAQSFEQSPAGIVRIGMLETFSLPLLPLLFRRMKRELPDVRLKIFIGSTGRVEEWLGEGEIDLSVNLGDSDSRVGDARSLCTIDSYLVGRGDDPLFRSPTIEFSALADLPLVLGATLVGLRGKINSVAERLQVAINPVLEVDMLKVHLDLAAAGDVYAVLTPIAFAERCRNGELAVAKIVKPSITREVLIGTSLRSMPSTATIRTAAIIEQLYLDLLESNPDLLGPSVA